jgi:hypothetical protein
MARWPLGGVGEASAAGDEVPRTHWQHPSAGSTHALGCSAVASSLSPCLAHYSSATRE